ncbi:MAG: CoA transferase [Chloroflexi bacterium]|nr:CoA transferase [Chloroflexota bacterium]
MGDERVGSLTGYRVLDLTDSKGAYCAKQLADLGADVIKIESPNGDPGRGIPPFLNDTPHPEKSLYFLHRNTNKRGITLNLGTEQGRTIFHTLIKKADVLVHNSPPDYMSGLGLSYEELKKINSEIIMASISEFGYKGPYKNWKGSNLVDFALSGTLITSGFPGKPPCVAPGSPAHDAASVHASISIIAALFMRGTTGEGQHIETSVHETSRMGLYPWVVPVYSYNTNPDGPPPMPETRMGASIYPVYPCKDGFIRVIALTPRQWDALVKVLGNPEILQLPEWRDFIYRIGNAADLYPLVVEYTRESTMTELFEAGSREGVPIAPVYKIDDFYNSPQTKARQSFVEVDHPIAGKGEYPAPPYRYSETSASIRCPAPCLGEHNEEIYSQELGYSKDELVALRAAGVL